MFSTELIDPAALEARRAETQIQPTVAVETAWCFELHAHLVQAIQADAPHTDLILMGGHASSLRLVGMNVSRGSRDTDYLTTLDEEAAVAVIEEALRTMRLAAEESLPAIPAGAFEAVRLTGGADATPLPLVSYRVNVPAVLDLGRDLAQIKVELHLVPVGELPPAEAVTDTPFPLVIERTLRVPALPWQIAYKATTLAAPPVGIPPGRSGQLARQLYDVDHLARIARGLDPAMLQGAVASVYNTELRYAGERAAPGEPWASMDERLDSLAKDLAAGGQAWTYASQFQDAQVPRAARINQAGWVARVHRVRLFLRYAANRDTQTFHRLCEVEEAIPIARAVNRQAFTAVRIHLGRGANNGRGAATNRERYWAHLLEQPDPAAAAEAVAELVPLV